MTSERVHRVCIPIANYPPMFSGMGIQIQRSLPFLRARGVEVTVLTHRLPRGFGSVPLDAACELDRVLAPGPGRIVTLRRALEFRRYFERRFSHFDLLYSDILGWEFLLNIPRLRSLGLPIVVEMVLLDSDDPVTISAERLGRLKMRLLEQVDAWVGISAAFLPRVRAAGIPEERFRPVYPGVDIATYRPLSAPERRDTRDRLALPQDSRVVISVGSVLRRKGFDRLLRVWARLDPVPGRDVLLIVGPASVEEGLAPCDLPFLREIQETIRSRPYAGTVRLIGRADNVHEYFGAADLFVFLSRREGLPIVSIEALASGLPCVVSPLPGMDEIVIAGRTGHIVRDPDDADGVSLLVSRLLDRPGERAAMSRDARELATRRFRFEARAESLASLCRELADRRPRRSTRSPGA